MQMQPVSSSSISAIGYDPATETLAVEFTSGSTYLYSGVPVDVFQALRDADSVGKYFYARIRNQYPATPV